MLPLNNVGTCDWILYKGLERERPAVAEGLVQQSREKSSRDRDKAWRFDRGRYRRDGRRADSDESSRAG